MVNLLLATLRRHALRSRLRSRPRCGMSEAACVYLWLVSVAAFVAVSFALEAAARIAKYRKGNLDDKTENAV